MARYVRDDPAAVAEAQVAEATDLPREGETRRALARVALVAAAREMTTAWGLRLRISRRGGAGLVEDREAGDRTRACIVSHDHARLEPLEESATVDGPRVRNRAGWRDGMLLYIDGDMGEGGARRGRPRAGRPRRAGRGLPRGGQ
jgi:hypothetical protein